jgi:hypothetical protein
MGLQTPEVHRSFDSDFKSRYSSDTYNYEGQAIIGHTPEGSGDYEDYKNGKTTTKEDKNQDKFDINLEAFEWVFYLILGGAIVFLVYILLKEGTTGGLFSSNKRNTLLHPTHITAETIEDTNFDQLIATAENDKDYRRAVRYYYLYVLKSLSLKNHIVFEDDKTNADYLYELQNAPFLKNFSYTSYLYNYIWYGKFEVDAIQYEKAKHNFTTLLKQVNA